MKGQDPSHRGRPTHPTPPPAPGYPEEVLRSAWNPAVDLAAAAGTPQPTTTAQRPLAIPPPAPIEGLLAEIGV
jgi:hypothetical protein